jgi:hypothetical protein
MLVRLVGPSKRYWFLGCLTRAPGAAGAPEGHPRPSIGVSGASGALPEKPMSQKASTEQSRRQATGRNGHKSAQRGRTEISSDCISARGHPSAAAFLDAVKTTTKTMNIYIYIYIAQPPIDSRCCCFCVFVWNPLHSCVASVLHDRERFI